MALRLTSIPDSAGMVPEENGANHLGKAGVMQDDWSQLMVAAQGGNGGAYRRLLAELTIWLTRYFTRRLPPGEIDDAVQETLIALHRNRHNYIPSYPLSAWLSAIAKRKWIDQLRALERRAADELTDRISTSDHETAVVSASVLTSLMAELKPAQARVIYLVKLQGFSLEEASTQTGQSVAAVKVNIHRGIGRLRTLVMKNNDVV